MNAIQKLKEITDEANLLNHTLAILSWDQETYMPEAAIEERSQQQALLSALVHQRLTSNELGLILEELGASDNTPLGKPGLSWLEQRFVRATWRTYSKARKIPEKFIREMAVATSQGQAAWAKAREASDFAAFLPHLDHLVNLKQEQASYLGFKTEAYDALLDEYEPDLKAETVRTAFDTLAKDLVPLVEEILTHPAPDSSFLNRSYPRSGQEALGKQVLTAMGYDFSRGRIDETAHPFCTTLGRKDVRTTTHYSEKDFTKSLYSIIHEGGHALYEMQFGADLPDFLASGTSLGIHESQSRTWENMIARSLPFWKHWFPRFSKIFPDASKDLNAEKIWRAVNKVERSHIRIYADEVTYSLHVMLRFNMELGLIRKDIKVKDIPSAWKDESKRLLGIVPANDKEGCLQDIHWSMGGLGYFPTYVLGNLYGAMFLEKAESQLPDLWTGVSEGKMEGLQKWLASNIHQHGSAKTPGELLQDVCGKSLDSSAFSKYLRKKYSALYGF